MLVSQQEDINIAGTKLGLGSAFSNGWHDIRFYSLQLLYFVKYFLSDIPLNWKLFLVYNNYDFIIQGNCF